MSAGLVVRVIIAVVILFVTWRYFRERVAPKGRPPSGPLQRALDILRRKTVRVVFEPEQFRNSLMSAALLGRIEQLFKKAEMARVENDPELTIVFLYSSGRLQFRFQLANGRTYGPFNFVDVQLTGRYAALDEDSPARPYAKAEGYAEQVIYSVAAMIMDPTGNTRV